VVFDTHLRTIQHLGNHEGIQNSSSDFHATFSKQHATFALSNSYVKLIKKNNSKICTS